MPTIEIYRVRIDPANVERLLEIRGAAVAEFQEQVPELLQADLVGLGERLRTGSAHPRTRHAPAPAITLHAFRAGYEVENLPTPGKVLVRQVLARLRRPGQRIGSSA